MAGCTRAAIVGNRMGIGIIPGVEFSCFDPSRGPEGSPAVLPAGEPDRWKGSVPRTTEARNRAGMEMIKGDALLPCGNKTMWGGTPPGAKRCTKPIFCTP